MNKSNVIYTQGDYVVRLCDVYDTHLCADITAYGIFNTVTGVREAETRRLNNAKAICDYEASAQLDPQLPIVLHDAKEMHSA